MIVLDTNVVSEAMKATPDPAVTAWLNAQAIETLYLSTVTVAEMRFGITNLQAGKRKDALSAAATGVLRLFDGRILPFDMDAADAYGDLAALARAAGRGFPTPDGYIAAIAVSRDFTVASRDTSPFRAAGIPVIDPWDAAR